MYNQHRVFARFQTPADFELFMDGIISTRWRALANVGAPWDNDRARRGATGGHVVGQRAGTSWGNGRAPNAWLGSYVWMHTDEQKIRAKIAQLQDWRSFGITTLAGGEVFEIERKRRVRRQTLQAG